MEFSSQIRLLPWIGNEYGKTDPKILILGESIYERPTRQFVLNMIQPIRDGTNPPGAFFTKVQTCYSNAHHWDVDFKGDYFVNTRRFWDSVAFYEYVQEPMAELGVRPSKQLWDLAKGPFLEVLEKLKPDVVVALGYETYAHLPDGGRGIDDIVSERGRMEVWEYLVDGRPVLVCRTLHPSARSPGFSPDLWLALFETLLRKYGFYR
jgi:hypothetical protein